MELTIEQALQQGVAAHREGKLQEAERLYRAILQFQPAHPDANHNLGVLAVSVNKAEAALPLFKTALEASPKIEQFWLSYIDALIKEKQFENAKQVFEQAKTQGMAKEKLNALEERLALIVQAPKSTLSEQKNSLTFSEKRKKLAEQKTSKKTTKQNLKANNPSQQQLGSLLEHYKNGRLSDAEKLATSISHDFPSHNFSWKILGAVFKATGRNSEAVNANQTVVTLSPQDAEAHSNLGNTLKELGRLDEAEASYTQAIALKPDFALAHSNLGNTLQELGRLDEAEASCRQAIGLKPDFALAHNNLGNTLKELGRLDESEASYTQAIALKPDFALAHSNLGNTLKELGRLDEAEASYTQAIALKPDFAGALMNRWQLLFDKKQFDAALRDVDLCDTKKSRACSLETLYMLGRIDEIYKRIEMQAEFDDGNLRVAAFSSFISEREKRNTAHEFCRNPQSFIHFSSISSHLEDANTFVTGVIGELNKAETIWEPHGKTTVKGFQTRKHINLFANPSGKVSQLKSIILNELDAYYLKFQNESCSFIKKWPSKKNLHGWHVILKKQGFQNSHIHPGGWLSGVIYLKVVPPLKKDEGAIEFSLNTKNYSDLKSPRMLHQPALGDIVFFPSSLHHRTIPFTTETDRIIVSFDLMPERQN
ncbi:tetratricopeptide repeat protein [Candidatus Njordibacter sp. Uisw_058]|uniref:tetratricopeptide repeat protein n=1 Tax=Candidatus Njordibacter sp. Uisw_058 TaxID=3230974 RepID=UPI003D486194